MLAKTTFSLYLLLGAAIARTVLSRPDAGIYLTSSAPAEPKDTPTHAQLSKQVIANVKVSAATSVPTPTQNGIASNCDDYYQVVSGDSCVGIVNSYGITLTEFYSWNPAVGSNCQVLLAGYYVCVGGTKQSLTKREVTTSTTTTTTPASSPSATPIPPPFPVQSGITPDCIQYYEAKQGDNCISIVENYSYLTLSEFESWNPAVGNDCGTLLEGYYYCVATTSVHG